jgi:hypothetical protein
MFGRTRDISKFDETVTGRAMRITADRIAARHCEHRHAIS